MNWFSRLFRTLPRRREKIISLQTWLNENPIYSGNSFEALVTHGWRKNELIFSCISKTANTAAQVELKFYRGKDGKELPEHSVKKLIQRPNPNMSEYDFWAAVTIYQKLAGVAYFEKERSAAGQVVALWPLRPDWVTPIAVQQTNGTKGKVGVGSYEYKVPGLPVEVLAANDVIVFPVFDPLGMFNRWPPVAVAARVGDVDNAVTDYLKLFMQKGGTPPGLLTTVQRLIDTQVDDIRRRWSERYGGFENWMEPAVLDSDARYQQIGLSFKDMGFDTIDARTEARTCMVLQVPPILLGAKIGLDRSTMSNYKEARTAWWEDDLLPMYANYEDVIINQLLVEFESGIVAAWDTSRVNALQEDRNSRWTRATTALQAGGILVNEFRAEVGLSDMGPAGQVFLRGFSTVEVPAQTGVRAVPEADTEPDDDEEDENTEDAKSAKNAKAKNPPDQEERSKHEKSMAKTALTFLKGQLARIETAIKKDAKKFIASQPTDIIDAISPARSDWRSDRKRLSDVDQAFWDAEDDAFFQAMFPELFQAALAGSETALAGLAAQGIGVDWALVNEAVVKWAKKYGYGLVKGINDTTRKILQSAVSDWIASGQPLDDLITTLRPTFGIVRAEMISVTEVTKAFAVGNKETWRESGVVSGSMWMTGRDELVCPICGDSDEGPGLDGQIANLDGKFMHPTTGAEYENPPAHVRCRCYLQPVVGGVE